jgi:hypothetical protein
MKRTLMLIGLFFTTAAASNAQSAYPVQDTVSAVAPHMPSLTRYSGSSNCWHGLSYNYTLTSRDSILSWAIAYPWEATGFTTSIGSYLTANDVTTLSTGEAEVYRDLKAAHMMVIDR